MWVKLDHNGDVLPAQDVRIVLIEEHDIRIVEASPEFVRLCEYCTQPVQEGNEVGMIAGNMLPALVGQFDDRPTRGGEAPTGHPENLADPGGLVKHAAYLSQRALVRPKLPPKRPTRRGRRQAVPMVAGRSTVSEKLYENPPSIALVLLPGKRETDRFSLAGFRILVTRYAVAARHERLCAFV